MVYKKCEIKVTYFPFNVSKTNIGDNYNWCLKYESNNIQMCSDVKCALVTSHYGNFLLCRLRYTEVCTTYLLQVLLNNEWEDVWIPTLNEMDDVSLFIYCYASWIYVYPLLVYINSNTWNIYSLHYNLLIVSLCPRCNAIQCLLLSTSFEYYPSCISESLLLLYFIFAWL